MFRNREVQNGCIVCRVSASPRVVKRRPEVLFWIDIETSCLVHGFVWPSNDQLRQIGKRAVVHRLGSAFVKSLP
jgi:hypothetical protein